MSWFKIIKVEDVDFDKDVSAFGYYSEGPHEIIDAFQKDPSLGQAKMLQIVLEAFRQGNTSPELKDVISQRIRIGHHTIFNYLENKLGRMPNDKELIDFITRVLMHEGTHAAMGSEQDGMGTQQAEYGAYTGQFPESVYYRIKSFLKHPASETRLMPDDMAMAMGMGSETISRDTFSASRLKNIISFVEEITSYLPDNKARFNAREKLTRLERQAMTQGKDEIAMVRNYTIPMLVQRYGNDNREFISNLLQEETPTDIKLASAGGVTTTSAPSMFNKVIKPRKEEDDE